MPLLVENVGGPAASIFSQEEYIRFIKGFEGRVGSLLDIGHAHLCRWDIPGTLRALQGLLRAVHLHDNGGNFDSHFPIGKGDIPWETIFSALSDCSPDLKLILEYDIGTPPERLGDGKRLLLQELQKRGCSFDEIKTQVESA